ncbi:hypothetical protein F4861DRAFT_544265 [Xylaria intraflava]|nr:hypothetical protein F4861DRAFT_544265 [Xylaria intraflava]
MDGVWGRPTGQALSITPTAHLRNEDNKIPIKTGNVDAGSRSDRSLNAATISIDSQSHQNNNTQNIGSVYEHDATFQPCPSLETCVATERAQLDSKKRKSPMPSLSMPAKKIRVGEGATRFSRSSGSHQLPAEIWQHIFTFLPPKMLGRLLSVDRCFNYLLDPFPKISYDARPSIVTGSLSALRPEVIWQFSRRRFWPTMPTPLRDHTELRMWQLACQIRCPSCDVTSGHRDIGSPSEKKYAIARVIWPFALTACDACLAKMTIKEVDLLLSSQIPSFLIPALPFVFIGDNMSVISSAMLQTGQVSMTSPITKTFLSSHVAVIQEEFASVRRMGGATVEEWLKGLEGRGKEHRADSLRWEKFEMSGGLARIRQRLSSQHTDVNGESNEALKASKISNPCSTVKREGESIELSGRSESSVTTLATQASSLTRTREGSVSQPVSEHQIRLQANAISNKTREKAEEMKAARRAEIENRSMRLEPPIPAQILARIPAFRAAIQITSPLSDTAWDLLKPRLMAQREDLNQPSPFNQETTANSQYTLPKSEDIRDSKTSALESKQQIDKDWDDAQTSLRTRMSALADEFIRDTWKNGRKVNRQSSPQFAADVLLYTRRKFYAAIRQEDSVDRAAGQSPISDIQSGPYTRKLTLENMKWLFDTKVKPFTGSYGREIFYCNGCLNNTKFYGLEGVIQHYAAKHTKSLSLGNAVVHWRAEWPEVPPFHPEPRKLKNQQTSNPPYKPNRVYMEATPTAHEQPFHQEGVLPSYGRPVPHNQYDEVPVQPPYMQGPFTAQPNEYAIPFLQGSAHHPSDSQLVGTTTYQGLPEFPHGAGLFEPTKTVDLNVYQGRGYPSYQSHTNMELQSYHQPQPPTAYHLKLDDIAHNAKVLWRSLAIVRQFPKPIRVFVVIHHVITKFRKRFSEDLALSLFTDGLSSHKDLRPLRNVNGLQCKVCQLSLVMPTDSFKKSYSLLQLVKHFQQHIQLRVTGDPVLDWRTDMVHQPDLPGVLSNLNDILSEVKTIGTRMRSLIKESLTGLAFSESQRILGKVSTNPPIADHKDLDHRSHLPAVHASKKQGPTHQPRLRQPETARHMSQSASDFRTQSMRRKIPKASQSPSMALADLPCAGHKFTNKASVDAETSNTAASTELPSAPIALAGGHDGEPPMNGEDDDFGLMAGLVLQLNQQASS